MLNDALELRAGAHELLVLGVGAKAHYPLDPGAVVPTAIEEDHFAGRGQVSDVALEIPLAALTVTGLGERRNVNHPRIGPLGDAANHPALAGGVPALEQYDDSEALLNDPVLQAHKLDLQAGKLLLVLGLAEDLGSHKPTLTR